MEQSINFKRPAFDIIGSAFAGSGGMFRYSVVEQTEL